VGPRLVLESARKRHFLPLPEVEPIFLCSSDSSTITTPIELFQLLMRQTVRVPSIQI